MSFILPSPLPPPHTAPGPFTIELRTESSAEYPYASLLGVASANRRCKTNVKQYLSLQRNSLYSIASRTTAAIYNPGNSSWASLPLSTSAELPLSLHYTCPHKMLSLKCYSYSRQHAEQMVAEDGACKGHKRNRRRERKGHLCIFVQC